MKPWLLNETYGLVKAAFGSAQERLVRDSARSVLDRQAFVRYHYQETLRLSKTFERMHLTNSSLIDMYTQGGQRKRAAFEKYIVKAAAHTTAAIQSLHAIPDILAHTVYFACAQNLEQHLLQDKNVNLPSVLGTLKHNHALRNISKLLASTQSGDLWRHLAAVSNLSKHRSVVRTALNEDWTGARKNFRELQLHSFERDGNSYAALSLQALLEPEYDRLSLVILTLGHELNTYLQNNVRPNLSIERGCIGKPESAAHVKRWT